MCVLALSSCGNNSSSTATNPTPTANNSVAVTANFGPTGEAGGFVNEIFTTVTVCPHGTQNCATIPNVEIDTGSIGLRLLSSALGSVTLNPISINGNPLEECVQFGDTSYTWGPMQLADVEIAGEKASDIPVQLLGPPPSTVPADCLANPVNSTLLNGGDDDTLATVGANGILGIGDGSVDCGSGCAGIAIGSAFSGYPYYICPSGKCEEVAVSTVQQAANPVAAFSTDRNGVMITLPPVGATGGVSVTGTMIFGIGTQADNALGSATLYSLDPCGSFPTVTYNGIAYTDTSCNGTGSGLGGFLDTGSTGLFVSDAATLSFLGISDCGQNTNGAGFYCVSPGTTATLSNIALSGNGAGSGVLTSLNIFDATTLFKTNNAVFNDLGSDSGTSPSTDYFDFGAPFFIGRTVFIGIAGEAVPGGVSAPNGFVAF